MSPDSGSSPFFTGLEIVLECELARTELQLGSDSEPIATQSTKMKIALMLYYAFFIGGPQFNTGMVVHSQPNYRLDQTMKLNPKYDILNGINAK